MTPHAEQAQRSSSSGIVGWSRVERVVLWFLSQLALVAAVAWIAFQLQQDAIAPAVLFPLAVGAAVGGGGALVAASLRAPSTRFAIAGALLAGLLVVVAQDYIGHRVRVRQLADQIGQQQPLAQVVGGSEFARPDFSAYLAGKIRAEAVWWTIDVALSGVAALASATWLLSRHRALAATYGASPTLLDTSESQRV